LKGHHHAHVGIFVSADEKPWRWLNMAGQDAELCFSEAEGLRKLDSMLAIRRGEGATIEPNIRATGETRYVLTSTAHGVGEFWLSEEAESKKA
jgi:hypothetical protein